MATRGIAFDSVEQAFEAFHLFVLVTENTMVEAYGDAWAIVSSGDIDSEWQTLQSWLDAHPLAKAAFQPVPPAQDLP